MAECCACAAMSVSLPVTSPAEGGRPIIAGDGSIPGFLRRCMLLAVSPKQVNRLDNRRDGSFANGYQERADSQNAKKAVPLGVTQQDGHLSIS
jgi:hypothetical protein